MAMNPSRGAVAMLQDWITLGGSTSTDTVIQSVRDWLRADDFSNIAFYLQAKEVSGTVTLSYQTAPVEDEPFWVTMGTNQVTAATTRQTVYRYASAGTPLSSLVRFKVTGAGSAWRITFRLAVVMKNT
jgi:hypothetical protein